MAERRVTAAGHEAAFWAKVQKTDGCWLWIGARANAFGHGYFSFRGGGALAHRHSYEIAHGRIPRGLFICHRCDVPACVRPDHLFAGTQGDNIRDAVAKGRLAPQIYRMAKTGRCKRGHEATPENTYKEPRGKGLRCRECKRINDRKRASGWARGRRALADDDGLAPA